jgi:hypothetical protein
MPKRQPTRIQMDVRPSAGECFSVGANVVFIFLTGKRKHHFGVFVKKKFCAVKNALSDFDAVLN